MKNMTKVEKSWILYDWANSVYATIIIAAIFPIYFAEVTKSAGVTGDVWWGYATSAATFAVAILAPLLGAIADFNGMKKKLFSIFLIIGVVFTAFMALTNNWELMLVGYMLSYFGYAGANLFYDSFLTDVTTRERMDKISAWGFAMGYVGGSTVPFLVSIGLVGFGSKIGIDQTMAIKISIIFCSLWWAVFSIPILKNVKQLHYQDIPTEKFVRRTFSNIGHTVKDIIRNKPMLFFIIAYFFYIDGVNTVIHMSTIYGSSLGLSKISMVLALLLTSMIAIPCSILFSKLSYKIGSIKMISIAIAIYLIICCVGFYLGKSLEPSQEKYINGYTTQVSKAYTANRVQLKEPTSMKAYDNIFDRLSVEATTILSQKTKTHDYKELSKEILLEETRKLTNQDDIRNIRLSMEKADIAIIEFLDDKAAFSDYNYAISRSGILFWGMAVLVGTSQGGIQALSRSFFGKLVPVKRSSEFFGFYEIFGKFAAVMGPALYALFAKITGHSSYGILSLIILFTIAGFVLFLGRKEFKGVTI